MAYRRAHHDMVHIESALAMTLYDETNPRSLAFQLAKLREHFDALPREGDELRRSEEQRLILDAGTRLQLIDVETLTAVDAKSSSRLALDKALGDIATLLASTSNAVTRNYFVDRRGPQQLQAGQE